MITAMRLMEAPVIPPNNENLGIEEILKHLYHPPVIDISCRFFYQDHSDENIVGDNIHRTPPAISLSVTDRNDSGIYVSYAMECDYFDLPIYGELSSDLLNLRKKLAYWLLKQQLLY